jgi:hypothetical protein
LTAATPVGGSTDRSQTLAADLVKLKVTALVEPITSKNWTSRLCDAPTSSNAGRLAPSETRAVAAEVPLTRFRFTVSRKSDEMMFSLGSAAWLVRGSTTLPLASVGHACR